MDNWTDIIAGRLENWDLYLHIFEEDIFNHQMHLLNEYLANIANNDIVKIDCT